MNVSPEKRSVEFEDFNPIFPKDKPPLTNKEKLFDIGMAIFPGVVVGAGRAIYDECRALKDFGKCTVKFVRYFVPAVLTLGLHKKSRRGLITSTKNEFHAVTNLVKRPLAGFVRGMGWVNLRRERVSENHVFRIFKKAEKWSDDSVTGKVNRLVEEDFLIRKDHW